MNNQEKVEELKKAIEHQRRFEGMIVMSEERLFLDDF